jgi:diphthamide synthase (EF-2-diphthine--ammonia ligase)
MIAAQAEALSLPLWSIPIPQPCSNMEYTARLQSAWELAARVGIEWVIFGDLFLRDIRAWREQLLSATALTPVFPLWMRPTRELAREMIHGGLNATVCAVDGTRLPATLVGKKFDEKFLSALPDGIDPCGENGEFHTFVRYIPGFSSMIECAVSSL